MAKNFKEVTAVWRGDLTFDAQAENGASVRTASGAFSPMDMLLGGLAACSGMDVIDILRKKRQAVTDLQVMAHGDRAADHPRRFTAFHVKYRVTGHKLDPDAVRRSIELSENKYCSAFGTLRDAGPITTEFEIVEAAPVVA
jgi:putative redox protein